MKNNDKYIRPVFWAAMGVFILVAAAIAMPFIKPLSQLVPVLGVLLVVLGLILLLLSIGSGFAKKLKVFLALAGAALAAMPVFILLHGLVYGLFIKMFGEGFWGVAANSDEPFFFILALVVCPIVYIVGAVGSIILLARSGRKAQQA
jgi:hypothetical protein